MGTFLSASGIIGKTEFQVMQALQGYTGGKQGGFEPAMIDQHHPNFCAMAEQSGNTTVYYTHGFLEWDETAAYLSQTLSAPVFSFHIHDGDLWMYLFYINGEVVDRFNPVPDYWAEDISDEETDTWKGNATLIARYVPGLDPVDIKNYFVSWDIEADKPPKAYPNDEFSQEDWQLLDFMKKLGLPFPLDDAWNPTGSVYRLWTKELPLVTVQPKPSRTVAPYTSERKPWWKFW